MSASGSISADKSAASTVSKSTKTSSGSTLLTSISLIALGAGLGAPLRGVVGVFGRDVVPSAGDFLAGEVLVAADRGLDLDRVRDSEVRGALYFLRPLGVAGTGNREMSSLDTEAERGRRGVNDIGRAILLVAGVGGTDIVSRGLEVVEVVVGFVVRCSSAQPRD